MSVFTSGSAPDPYRIIEWEGGNPPGGNRFNQGKTLRDPRLVSGENTGVFIVAGQSNASNYMDAAYTPTHGAKIDNLNPYDGAVYAASDPLLGCETYSILSTPGNFFLRVADKLIANNKFARVILIPVAIGGTPVALWNTQFGDRLIVAFKRAAAVGLPITGVLWMQGEADVLTTQSAYQIALAAVIARPRALGFSAPWFIAKCTYFTGTTAPAVRAAQAAIVNGTDIFAGPDTDTLTSASRYDNGHFNATGADAASTLWETAIAAVF